MGGFKKLFGMISVSFDARVVDVSVFTAILVHLNKLPFQVLRNFFGR